MKNQAVRAVNLRNYMLVGTFFALWVAVYFNKTAEEYLAYLLILSFGILHGSNDIKLIRTATKGKKKPGFLIILTYYLIFIALAISLLYLAPLVAIAFFLVFSAYHFGEQHWNSSLEGKGVHKSSLYISYGLFVLTLLFKAHGPEVESILMVLTNTRVPAGIWDYLSIGCFLFFVLLYTLLFKQKYSIRIRELFVLLVFYIVFNTASLIWSFAIYFIIWHSIPSLNDQLRFLYGKANWPNFYRYFKASFWYWAVSVLALFVLVVVFSRAYTDALPILFAFIIAITFPHVIVIERLRKS